MKPHPRRDLQTVVSCRVIRVMATGIVIAPHETRRARGVLRWLLLAAGWFALVLGVIGVLVPILPTAPFLLLALACFSRSSETMTRRLYELPVAGRYLRDWQENGITPAMKWGAIGALWLAALAMLAVAAKTALLKTLVVAVTLLTTLHFLLLPTRRPRRRDG